MGGALGGGGWGGKGVNDWLLRLYHYAPYPVNVLAASARGYYLRWWRYGPETEKLVQEDLGEGELEPGEVADLARGTAGPSAAPRRHPGALLPGARGAVASARRPYRPPDGDNLSECGILTFALTVVRLNHKSEFY